MADTIRIKGGSGAVPTLQDRELGYSKTEKALYIGTGSGNVRLYSGNDTERIDTLIEDVKSLQAEITALNEEIEAIKNNITAVSETTSE